MNHIYFTDRAATPAATGTQETDATVRDIGNRLTEQSETQSPDMQFYDRVVPYPNRIKLKKVSGEGDNTLYDVENCEGMPSVAGTPLNAKTMTDLYGDIKLASADSENVKNALSNIKITASAVDTDVAPSGTATIDYNTRRLNMSLQIPKGERGIQGLKGDKGEAAVIYNGTQACSGVEYRISGTTLIITTTPKT